MTVTRVQVQDQGRRALFGWSPPDLPADTMLKRRADRLLPRTGVPALLYCAAVVGLLSLAPHLPERANLAADGLAALAGAAWCGLNFWRCRHAHCVVTSTGWAALSVLAFTEAVLGRSLIGGDEQPVFLAVLAAAVLFEAGWRLARGSNSVGAPAGWAASACCGTGGAPRQGKAGRSGPRGERPGAPERAGDGAS
jgi:hypothetical protein